MFALFKQPQPWMTIFNLTRFSDGEQRHVRKLSSLVTPQSRIGRLAELALRFYQSAMGLTTPPNSPVLSSHEQSSELDHAQCVESLEAVASLGTNEDVTCSASLTLKA